MLDDGGWGERGEERRGRDYIGSLDGPGWPCLPAALPSVAMFAFASVERMESVVDMRKIVVEIEEIVVRAGGGE